MNPQKQQAISDIEAALSVLKQDHSNPVWHSTALGVIQCAIDALKPEPPGPLEKLMSERHTTTPEVDEGWIPHTPGDKMPCDPGTKILIRRRDGVVLDIRRADGFSWCTYPVKPDQIVAWKPVKP